MSEQQGWKVLDLMERIAREDPYELVRDEMTRVAGRLEAKGLQKVRIEIAYVDERTLHVKIRAKCPCGAKLIASDEMWPIDSFHSGPGVLIFRLTQMETAMLDHMQKPAT